MENRHPCPKCHEYNVEGNVKCWHCGTRLTADRTAKSYASSPVSTVIPALGLMAVVLGGGFLVWKANAETSPDGESETYVAAPLKAPAPQRATSIKIHRYHRYGQHTGRAGDSSVSKPTKLKTNGDPKLVEAEGQAALAELRDMQQADNLGMSYGAYVDALAKAKANVEGYLGGHSTQEPFASALVGAYQVDELIGQIWNLKLHSSSVDLISSNPADRQMLDAALKVAPDLQDRVASNNDGSGTSFYSIPYTDVMSALWSKSQETLQSASGGESAEKSADDSSLPTPAS